MKIILIDLPEKQIAWLKRNCEAQFEAGIICAAEPSELCIWADKGSTWENCISVWLETQKISADEILLVSQNKDLLNWAVNANLATIAYQEPQTEEKQSFTETELVSEAGISQNGASCAFPQVDIIVEGFEEVDACFLERVYQRHHRIPWKILETKRLVVRELALADMDALVTLYSYPGMTDYIEKLYPYEEEMAYQKAYIENMYHFFGYGMWLVFEKESGTLIGRAGVEHREELNGELELGYAIGTPWQKRGYAFEVCKGILSYVKEELGFEKICSLVQPENEASVKLLKKLGFYKEEEWVLAGICYHKFEKSL